MTIHPKTGGAALGGTLGVLITAILASLHGVHLAPELPGAISAFLAAAGAFLAPSADPASTPTLLSEPITGQLATTFTPAVAPAPVTVTVHPAVPDSAPAPVSVPVSVPPAPPAAA